MPNKPVILDSKVLASTKIFQIEGLHLRFSNGEERHFERLRGRGYGAVMIVPLLDAETVLLIREYGVGMEDYYLGFPKGRIDEGEDIFTAANRELMEEIGYGANKLSLLASFSTAPAYNTRKMSVLLATDLYQKKLIGDEPEEIQIVPWKLSELDALLQRDDFHEAKSIAALYMVRDLILK